MDVIDGPICRSVQQGLHVLESSELVTLTWYVHPEQCNQHVTIQ